MRISITISSIVLNAYFIGSMHAGQPPAPVPDVPAVARSAPMVPAAAQSRRFTDLFDRRVILQNGDVVGTIDDIVIGPRHTVDFVIAFHRDDEFFAIPYSAVNFNRHEAVQLNLTPELFATLPFFTNDTWPNFSAPLFRQQMMTVFGPSGIGPAPNANTPVVSSEDAVNPADRNAATRTGATNTDEPISNRLIERPGVGSAPTPEEAKRPATPSRATGTRGAARAPVGGDAPPAAPDASPGPGGGKPVSRSGPAPRPSSTGEYNQRRGDNVPTTDKPSGTNR